MVGEHIRTRRAGRWTHAIDCGDETVIHLAEDGPGATRVRRSYRPEFVSGAETVEVVTHRQRTFPANEIVARAYSRISDPGLAAMFRDSEAFAEWCATGRLPASPSNVALSGPPVAAASPAQAPQPPAKARPSSAPRAAGRAAPRARRPAKRAAAKGARPKRAAKKSPPARKKPARRGARKAKRGRR
jgi:lecithin:retinol acyltransferase